jgi:hypothetical protein
MRYLALNLMDEILWTFVPYAPIIGILMTDQPNSVFLMFASDFHSNLLRAVHIYLRIIELILDSFCDGEPRMCQEKCDRFSCNICETVSNDCQWANGRMVVRDR